MLALLKSGQRLTGSLFQLIFKYLLKSLPTQAKFRIQMPHPNTIFIEQFSILCMFQNLATFLVSLFGLCL